ncbi:MAG: hypothetical protein WB987_04410 [Candidatus Acidiferrales bacterium]
MKLIAAIVLTPALVCSAVTFAGPAQKQSPHTRAASADRLGLTCAQILQMSSADWVKKFNAATDATPPGTIRALAAYGKCYDARTNRLTAALGKSGKGPLMGARANFRDFEQALSNFSAKALAATDPPADEVKVAYAALYAKQFRSSFYGDYVEHLDHRDILSGPQEDAGDIGKAKNHFGELLGLLPDDKMHEVHKSFAEILDSAMIDSDRRLQLYRYAIFLLESPAETPFSPPPF